MLSEVRWADYTLSGSHPGLHGILAEQPPAADALQPTLRCGFRAQLRRSVRRPCPAIRNFHVAPHRESERKKEVYE
jgi:hypothetical protein